MTPITHHHGPSVLSSCSHSNSHKWFCRLGRKDEHASAPNIYLGCRLIEGREPAEWMFTEIHRITSMFTKGAKLSEKPEPSERQNHVFIVSSFARSDLHALPDEPPHASAVSLWWTIHSLGCILSLIFLWTLGELPPHLPLLSSKASNYLWAKCSYK